MARSTIYRIRDKQRSVNPPTYDALADGLGLARDDDVDGKKWIDAFIVASGTDEPYSGEHWQTMIRIDQNRIALENDGRTALRRPAGRLRLNARDRGGARESARRDPRRSDGRLDRSPRRTCGSGATSYGGAPRVPPPSRQAELQSGCRDLNSGPRVPQTDALTRLRHTPCWSRTVTVLAVRVRSYQSDAVLVTRGHRIGRSRPCAANGLAKPCGAPRAGSAPHLSGGLRVPSSNLGAPINGSPAYPGLPASVVFGGDGGCCQRASESLRARPAPTRVSAEIADLVRPDAGDTLNVDDGRS